MSDDVYLKLGNRLNENPVKMPLVESFFKLMREFYTEEQAALAADFPKGEHSLQDLARHFNSEEQELFDFLETMADGGLVFTARTESGDYAYSLTPFFPGAVEFRLMRGTDTPKDRRVARIMTEFNETLETLMAAAAENPEVVKEMIPEGAARTITVERELPHGKEIYPYEKLSELVNQENSFAASVCYCRHHEYLLDNPCQVEGVPQYSCLSFGKAADFVVDRKFGKKISKEECLKILEDVEKAGLIHNTNNFLGSTAFICNCCGCCCGFAKMLKNLDFKALLAVSNFGVVIDEETCTGCGDCLERCPMEALSLADGVVTVNKDHCVGCGNCVSVCPTESLAMERRSDTKPPEFSEAFGGFEA